MAQIEEDRCATAAAPMPVVVAEDRPALPGPRPRAAALLLLLPLSLLVHAAVIAALDSAPRPMPSAGIPAVIVDIVLGNDAAAGLASTAGHESVSQVRPTETTPFDASAEAEPVEPVAMAEVPFSVAANEAAAADTVVAPQADAATAENAVALQAARSTTERPDEQSEERTAVRRPVTRTPQAAASAASGLGRGGSAAGANYRGRVAAHLARHKRFPPDARRRGERGSAEVGFSIDGRGRVTAVRIVRSSGFAGLDRAATAMVWGASPFPSPPDRKPHQFSVPISYAIR